MPVASTQRLLIVLAVLTLTAVSAMGCARSVQGSASKKPPSADASELQPGNYPTTPRPPLGEAGPAGHLVEARRMADFLVMPFQVDPALTKGGNQVGSYSGPVKDADAAGVILDITVPDAVKHNFVAGFAAERDNRGAFTTNLQNVVLRYQTPEDAAAAVAELAAKSTKLAFSSSDPPPVTRPTEIPRHPEARAITWESYGSPKVLAHTAHGPFVLTQQTLSSAGVEAAAELAAATLEKQIPLIDAFKPTPVNQLADLPLDPDGLLARTLEPPEEDRNRVRFGVYGTHGFLTYAGDPAADQKLLEEAGVTNIALSGTDVYQARDAAGANQLLDGFAAQFAEDMDPTDGVPGLAESQCFTAVTSPGTDYASSYYRCLFTADRYVVDVFSKQKIATYQKASAQYLMLTAE